MGGFLRSGCFYILVLPVKATFSAILLMARKTLIVLAEDLFAGVQRSGRCSRGRKLRLRHRQPQRRRGRLLLHEGLLLLRLHRGSRKAGLCPSSDVESSQLSLSTVSSAIPALAAWGLLVKQLDGYSVGCTRSGAIC